MKRKYQRIVALTLLVLMIASNIMPVSADVLNDRAKALNTLSILKGDGVNFNLTGQLKRSEAATFIVRMLGQENHVLTNQDTYNQSRFSDVKVGQWYVPYVEFCAKSNLITGFPDGRFGPDEYLSEKSALTLLLKSLGYTWGTDFDWNTVYQKAYTVGILKDSSYLSKKADNVNYTRGNLVNALYETLTLKKYNSTRSLLDELISLGVTTKDVAKSVGLIKDTVVTAIASAQAMDLNKVSIKFNENIGSLAVSDISIYEISNATKKLTVSIESQAGNEIILKTSAQVQGTNYKVDIAKVTDAEGFAVGPVSATFKGYMIPEVKSDFFKISKIEAVDKKTVNIYFTQPINVNVEYPNFYEIVHEGAQFVAGSPQTILVKADEVTQNSVMLYLKDKEFIENEVYTIYINGNITSAYSVKLNQGTGDKGSFIAKANSAEGFKMNYAMPISNNALMIAFNKDVDVSLAEKKVNYSIKQKSTGIELPITSATVIKSGDKKGKAVTVNLATTFDRTQQYELTIEYLPDRFKEGYLEDAKHTFIGYYPDKVDLKIVGATNLDAGTVIVYFDRPLDPVSALMTGNYVITSTTSGTNFYPSKVYYDSAKDPNTVKLYLPAEHKLNGSGEVYKISIQSSLTDSLGNMSSRMVEYNFGSGASITAKPLISEAVIIAQDTIKIKLNKDIALDVPNILNTNYLLEYKQDGSTFKKVPTGVNYFDGTTLILKFDSLDTAVNYTLKFESLKDYVGNIRTAADGQNTIEVRVGK